MLTNRSIFIFGIALLVVTFTAMPTMSQNNNYSKSIPHTIKSATELDYPPFSLIREDGSPDGFSVDLLKAVIQTIGLDINFIIGPWHEIKQKLIDGHIDVLPFVSYSSERDKVLDFTVPYLRMHGTIFVRKEEKAIRSETDLWDKEVLVMRGDTAHEYAVSKKLSNKLILTDSFEEAMQLLSDGKHDAVIIQQLVGFQLIKKLNISNIVNVGSFQESSLKPVAKPLSSFEQKFCIAVQEGDKELLTLLNEGLTIAIANGTYEELYNKWFGPILPQPSVSLAMMVKHLFLILLSISFLIGIVGIWFLKRQVARKTQYLKKEIKKRKRVEDSLRRSEEKFRILYNSSPDMYASVSPDDASIMLCNETLLKKTGYSRKEIIGSPIYKIYHDDCINDAKKVFQQFVETGVVQNKELILKRKDGTKIDVSLNANAVKDETGKILHSISSWRDITEHKRAEDTLKKSEKKLKSIFRAAPTGIGVVSDRVFQQVNNRFCEIIGYSKNELIGQDAKIIYPSDEEYEYVGKEKYVQIINKGTGTVETRLQHKDGKIINVILSSTPIDLDDLSKGVTFTALDITYLKKKESELLESKEKYRSMMEAMDDAAYICSSDFHIEYMNPSMINRTGYDATNELCYKVVHGLDKRCSWCVFEKVMKGESINYEIVSPLDDKIYHVFNSPIFHADESVSVLVIFHDVTELKKMESHLQQSQKMESIGTLAGGIAHDFNNILFPILGHTELLMADILEDNPFRESLNEIHTGALRARDLVKQILTFSRQESGELILMKIQPIIKEALKLIRSTIPTTIEIKQDIQADCDVIKADPTQIHQIIMNLATNAYHAMEDTGGALSVSLKEVEFSEHDVISPDMTSGVYICLAMADTGIGMDKNVMEKIFEPFFTTKDKGKGTGMGLSVVHGIVKSMDGAIQVYSEPGKGTEFKIYFPVEKNSFDKQNNQIKQPIQGGIEHILLVDDEKGIIEIAKQMLKRLGYQVTSRTSSIEALEAFRNNPDKFNLVITDMGMPNMAGDKLAVELTKIRPDIPILLCTGFSETMSEEKAAALGIKGFLLKPIVLKDLAQKVRELLDNNMGVLV